MFSCRVIYFLAMLAFVSNSCRAHEGARPDLQPHFEGDIAEMPKSRSRNAILQVNRWPGGKIPYTFRDWWGPHIHTAIQAGMREIEEHTCIKFIPRTNERDYLEFRNHSECYIQTVGKLPQGGMQWLAWKDVGLPLEQSCFDHPLIVHELLHAVGLYHEQSRQDRDYYIDVYWQNIISGGGSKDHAFWIFNDTNTYGIPYDYYSVMHYPKYAYSKNGQLTMLPKDRKYEDIIGNQQHGSWYDWEKVRRIYQCDTSSTGRCEDRKSDCVNWAYSGECRKNPKFMNVQCPWSCGVCHQCQDYKSGCADWARNGECGRNPGNMVKNCPKSCNKCRL